MTPGIALSDFAKRLDQTADDTEALLAKLLSDTLLPAEIARPKRLIEAMRYSSLGGGERLRPFLVVESSAGFGVARQAALLVDVARLQQMKTGALLHYGCIAGAILGQSSAKEHQALDDYGRALGEAFQIADDLLDVEGDAAALGKKTGQDAALGKTTFVTQLGVEGAKRRVGDLLARADSALSIFGARGDVLRAAARFVADRKN